MNQVFAGVAALIIALTLWGLGKKPRSLLITKSTQNQWNGPGQEQLSLVTNAISAKRNQDENKYFHKSKWHPPQTMQERISLQKQLKKLISGNPEERLEAITLSKAWGHTTILPILRKGLKDSDGRVVAMAASAIEKFRKVPNLQNDQKSTVRLPPRNVARMR